MTDKNTSRMAMANVLTIAIILLECDTRYYGNTDRYVYLKENMYIHFYTRVAVHVNLKHIHRVYILDQECNDRIALLPAILI
jgi:sulfur carrier protein ThiS